MKKSSLLLSILIISVSSWAQKLQPAQIPAAVTGALNAGYAQATEVKWEKKGELYKAGFKIEKTDHDVWFDNSGKVTKHRYEVKKDALPAAVRDAITRDFSTYKIDDCERTDENGTSTYKVELKSDAGKKNVHFTADGKKIDKKADK